MPPQENRNGPIVNGWNIAAVCRAPQLAPKAQKAKERGSLAVRGKTLRAGLALLKCCADFGPSGTSIPT